MNCSRSCCRKLHKQGFLGLKFSYVLCNLGGQSKYLDTRAVKVFLRKQDFFILLQHENLKLRTCVSLSGEELILSIVLLRWNRNLVFRKTKKQLIKLLRAIWVGVQALPKLHASFLILGIGLVKEMKLGTVHNAFLETPLLFIKTEKEAAVAKDKAFLRNK